MEIYGNVKSVKTPKFNHFGLEPKEPLNLLEPFLPRV